MQHSLANHLYACSEFPGGVLKISADDEDAVKIQNSHVKLGNRVVVVLKK